MQPRTIAGIALALPGGILAASPAAAQIAPGGGNGAPSAERFDTEKATQRAQPHPDGDAVEGGAPGGCEDSLRARTSGRLGLDDAFAVLLPD